MTEENSLAEAVPIWLEGIEGDALRSLISSDSKVIRVVAGPRSGKTTGLKRRVQRLKSWGARSTTKHFCGTFTRAIAKDLAQALGVDITSDEFLVEKSGFVNVSTLHSHALRLVRRRATSRPGRELRFLLDYEKEVMLYDIEETLPSLPIQTDRQSELKKVCAAGAEGVMAEC
jgi:superfamily I DNA/RNA helicase